MTSQVAAQGSEIDRPSRFVRLAHYLHVVEKFYVMAAFSASAGETIRSDTGMWQFLTLWIVLAVVSVLVAILPGVPRAIALFAEVFLGLLVVGHFVAANSQWLPKLNRFWISDEMIPLAQRRYIAWNMIAGLALAWSAVSYAAIIINKRHWRSLRGVATISLIIVASAALLVLFVVLAFAVIN